MNNDMKIYVCPICGNVIEVIDGNGKALMCCGNPMKEMVANTVDAATEKHIPVYEKNGDKIEVCVGEVEHPMEKEHYIAWIAQVADNNIIRVCLEPGQEPKATFPYVKGATLYAYCNKHGLWKKEIE